MVDNLIFFQGQEMLMFFFYFGKASMHHRYFLEKQKEIVI